MEDIINNFSNINLFDKYIGGGKENNMSPNLDSALIINDNQIPIDSLFKLTIQENSQKNNLYGSLNSLHSMNYDNSTSERHKREIKEDKSEDKSEDKTEDKSEDKSEDKTEDKTEDKSDNKINQNTTEENLNSLNINYTKKNTETNNDNINNKNTNNNNTGNNTIIIILFVIIILIILFGILWFCFSKNKKENKNLFEIMNHDIRGGMTSSIISSKKKTLLS